MTNYFEEFSENIPTIKTLAQSGGVNGFFAQEALRFYTIAGTLLKFDGFKLDEKATNDERYITHVLMRSLLENFFTIVYLFDNPAETQTRYEALKNSFKDDYRKLMSDLAEPEWKKFMQCYQTQLEPANSAWSIGNKLPNVHDMLTAVKSDCGDHLYPMYRITSFDIHGRSLGTIFQDVFGKQCNFPVLKIREAFELISKHYLIVLNDLRNQGVLA